ncbi:hypothetical protein LCGC14_0431190 [marine sediment metagenome]|uniref:Uncharacterized protein n=1 Tax=marine sediment metagenome TaxID=412755 RepID=A0A0F9SU97_9ZZZZ
MYRLYEDDGYNIVAEEVEPTECYWCLDGEVPDEAEMPFLFCAKHLVICEFVLDKAGLHPKRSEPLW